MRIIWCFILPFLILSFLSTSCKSDNSDEGKSEEELYFDDYKSPEALWGHIDTLGEIIIERRYDDLRPFNDGLAIANSKGKWGFISRDGKTVIPHRYRAAYPFKNGLARIQNFNKKYGFIDMEGNLVIPDTFNRVFDFDSGLARAQKGENYGFIDKNGNWVIEPRFKKCKNFENGFAIVYQYGKAALIDRSGKYIIRYSEGNDKILGILGEQVRLKKDSMGLLCSASNLRFSIINI